jgi:hypothetical protein
MTKEQITALVYGNPDAAVELMLQLAGTAERLTARQDEQERMIALLTRNSPNSSKPPSVEGPAGKSKARRARKFKKGNPGGQPG